MSWWRPELWKGSAIPLHPLVPKGKPANYYDQTRRRLGYTTLCVQYDLEFEKPLPLHSSDSSDWASDVSMGVAFKKFFTNMASTSQVEPEEDIEPFDTNPWAQQLDLHREKHFEQRDPPTENSNSNWCGWSNAPETHLHKWKFVTNGEAGPYILIKEYIDVFAWSYEDMPGVDPQVAMHRLNIKPDAKPVKQQQWRFWPDIIEAIEAEAQKLIKCGFIREE